MAKVLVLIVTYNGEAYIEDCLSSLRAATGSMSDIEVLVVDNCSRDRSAELVRSRFPDVDLIENTTNVGFAGGNNVGLRHALERDFDFVYLLNQDTEVEPDFLRETLRAAASDANIAAVQSKVLLYHDPTRINSIGNKIHYLGFGFCGGYGAPDTRPNPEDGGSGATEITYTMGAGALIRVSALREAGLFNDDLFLYHDDLDLCWRLRLQGYRIVLAPRSVVYHKYEFSRNEDKFYYMERNRYRVLLQNCRVRTLLLLALPLAAMQVGMLFFALANGYTGAEARILGDFFRARTWRRIRATRKQVQEARRVGDREVFRHFCGTMEFEELRSPVLRYFANPVFNGLWAVLKPLIRW